jgi:hypothetical protein
VISPPIRHAAAAGVPGVIVYDCASCDGAFIRMAYEDAQPMSAMFILHEDGVRLRAYLLARRAALLANPPAPSNFTSRLYGVVNGTGPLDPAEFSALRTVASRLTFDAAIVTNKSPLRPWSDMPANPTVDPCLDRAVGIYCERGHVQSIYFNFMAVGGMIDDAIGQLTQLTYISIKENTDVGGTDDIETCDAFRSGWMLSDRILNFPCCAFYVRRRSDGRTTVFLLQPSSSAFV